MIDCFVNSLSKIHDELRKVYPFYALDDPQPSVYSLASRPNVADGLVSQWCLPRRSSSIADLISPHSPPKKKKKARNVVISYSYYSSRVFDNELL